MCRQQPEDELLFPWAMYHLAHHWWLRSFRKDKLTQNRWQRISRYRSSRTILCIRMEWNRRCYLRNLCFDSTCCWDSRPRKRQPPRRRTTTTWFLKPMAIQERIPRFHRCYPRNCCWLFCRRIQCDQRLGSCHRLRNSNLPEVTSVVQDR